MTLKEQNVILIKKNKKKNSLHSFYLDSILKQQKFAIINISKVRVYLLIVIFRNSIVSKRHMIYI